MGRAMSVGVLTAVLAGGCVALLETAAATSGRYPRLLHSPLVERVDLLTLQEKQVEAWLEYEAQIGLPADVLKAEQVIGDSDAIRSVKSGGGYHGVVAQRLGQNGPPQGVWVFDEEWQARGEVAGLPAHNPGLIYTVSLYLDESGTQWAAVVAQAGEQSVTDVGLISPARLRFERKLQYHGCARADLAWRGDHIVVSPDVTADRRDFILDLDPASGEERVLLQEGVGSIGRGRFGGIRSSPDGRYIAFGRAPYPPNWEFGLWLLDVETGECEKILYDNTGLRDCVAKRWSGADTLVFTHTVQRGARVKQRWYRARLRLPG